MELKAFVQKGNPPQLYSLMNSHFIMWRIRQKEVKQMPYYQEKNGSISYYRSDSRFNPYTHGGHSDEHKEEIDRAINEIVDKKLKEAIPQIYQ